MIKITNNPMIKNIIKNVALRISLYIIILIQLVFILYKLVGVGEQILIIIVAIYIVSWPIYLIADLLWSLEKNKQQRKITAQILIGITAAIVIGIYWYSFSPKYQYSSFSPDGQYELKVYKIPTFMSMPGDGGSICAKVKLYKGFWRIDDCSSCQAFTSEIYVTWHLDKDRVDFAPGHEINLTTGDCQ